MRYLLTACLIGLLGCTGSGQDGDVATMEAMAQSLEQSLGPDESHQYRDERTFDCPGGGSALVKVQWSMKDGLLYSRKYYVSWEYTTCSIMPYGTIDGSVRYSTTTDEMPDRWGAQANYFADLTYDGGPTHDCDAYMTLKQHTRRMTNLRLDSHCAHPVWYWWVLWGIVPR